MTPRHPFHWDHYSVLYDRFADLASDVADTASALHQAENLPAVDRRLVAKAVTEAQRAIEEARGKLQAAWSLRADLERAANGRPRSSASGCWSATWASTVVVS